MTSRRDTDGTMPDEASDGVRPVLVWDAPTRAFHWLAAALVVAAYATWRLGFMAWHAWAGYALLWLLFFRFLWGGLGSDTARFSRFLAAPGPALRHLAHSFRREPDRQVGHNPAGGWMVVLLLVLLLGETLSGLYVGNDIADEGPLSELVPARLANLISALHTTIVWRALLAAVALHLLAIAVYAAAKRQDLVRPMITGRKLLAARVPPPAIAGHARLLILLGLSALAAAALINFL